MDLLLRENEVMKRLFVTDWHLGAPKSLTKTFEEMLSKVECAMYLHGVAEDQVYFLGDNWDLKNTLKSEIDYYKECYRIFRQKFNNVCSGNHEGDFLNVSYRLYLRQQAITDNSSGLSYSVRKKVMLEHGHRFFWLMKKAFRWETTNFKGISKARWATMCAANSFDEAFLRNNLKNTTELQSKLLEYVPEDVDTFICGHNHVHEIFDEVIEYGHRSIRFICLPRGMTMREV